MTAQSVPEAYLPLALIVVVLSTNGCAPTGHGEPPESDGQSGLSRPPEFPQSGLARGLALPLEPYMENYNDHVAIEKAKNIVAKQCMADFGFDYQPIPPGSMPPPQFNDSNTGRRYGITDAAEASEYGYHLRQPLTSMPSPGPLSDSGYSVLTGRQGSGPNAPKAPTTYNEKSVPDGGCYAMAERSVGATYDMSLVGRLNTESMERSEVDPKVRTAVQGWANCMAAKGYRVDTPLNAAEVTGIGEKVSSKEISTATADIRCKEETQLITIWFSVETELQKSMIEANALPLAQARDQIALAVKRSGAAPQ